MVELDRQRVTLIGHGQLPFWNPVAPADLDRVVAAVPLNRESQVLDIGCGAGELLIRCCERSEARGVGVDPNPGAIDLARRRTRERVADGVVVFRAEPFDAGAFERGAFDLTVCVGSTHACGGFAEMPAVMRGLTRAGGHVVLGDGGWKCEPDAAYLDWIGSTRDEMPLLRDMASSLAAAGFEVVEVIETSEASWDAYENAYLQNFRQHAARHPGEEAEAMLGRAERWHEGYKRWGRATMGFAVFLLRVPARVAGSP